MFFIFPSEIFIIFILIAIMTILAGIDYIANNMLQIIIWVAVIIIFIVVAILLFKLFAKLYERNRNRSFFVSFIAISIFWLCGPLFFMEFEFLDKSDVYFPLFGDNILVRYLIVPIVIVFLVSLGLLLLAYKAKMKFIQSLLSIVSAIFIVAFSLCSANICTKSYSDAITKEFVNESTKQCFITKDAKIYYPSFSDQKYTLEDRVYALRDNNSIYRFPLLCPLKFSNNSFEEGDKVYVKDSASLSEGKFIKVTDGIKSGFIEIDALEVSASDIY